MVKKRVLVLGATGFIGRNIAEAFLERDDMEVRGTFHSSTPWAHPEMEMVRVDLTDREQVNRIVEGADIIVQAAATTSGAREIIGKPYCHVTDNAVMNSLVFRAAFDHGVSHVVFFSCSVMYRSSDAPVKETDFDPNVEMYPPYFGVGWTKVYIEKMCEFYSRIGDTKYSVLRHSNIYGPHDKYDLERSHVFGATVTKVMTAPEGGKITVWGDGREKRDLLYVSDLVEAVSLCVERQESRFDLYNIGYGSAVAVNDLVGRIIAVSGRTVTVGNDPSKPTLKVSLSLDASRAKERLGWVPVTALDEGIKKTIEWYASRLPLEEKT